MKNKKLLKQKQIKKLSLNSYLINSKLNNKSNLIKLDSTVERNINKVRYLPSFSKEWKNTIYNYNKNNIKNLSVNDITINKIIASYFNLYFKKNKFINQKKFLLLRRRRNILRRIYISNVEIKHTNNKAIINLYVVNREKKILEKKYKNIFMKITKHILNRYFTLYKLAKIKLKNMRKLLLKKAFNSQSKQFYNKKEVLTIKLKILNLYRKIRYLMLKSIFFKIRRKLKENGKYLKRCDYLYSLNQYKFNKLNLLAILSNILQKVINKKIEYNIINLKNIAYHSDIFTNALALKLKKRKIRYLYSMRSILNRSLVITGAKGKSEPFIWNWLLINNQNLNYLTKSYSSSSKYNSRHSIIDTIFKNIKYKNLRGIRLEVKGRLTKRYRADRAIHSSKWKGGLKTVDSSFKRKSSMLFRGNTPSNVAYSFVNSKRRIGAFAVKGWIAGK